MCCGAPLPAGLPPATSKKTLAVLHETATFVEKTIVCGTGYGDTPRPRFRSAHRSALLNDRRSVAKGQLREYRAAQGTSRKRDYSAGMASELGRGHGSERRTTLLVPVLTGRRAGEQMHSLIGRGSESACRPCQLSEQACPTIPQKLQGRGELGKPSQGTVRWCVGGARRRPRPDSFMRW
jgi:hypothetical protein